MQGEITVEVELDGQMRWEDWTLIHIGRIGKQQSCKRGGTYSGNTKDSTVDGSYTISSLHNSGRFGSRFLPHLLVKRLRPGDARVRSIVYFTMSTK